MTVLEAIEGWAESYRDNRHKLFVSGAITAGIGAGLALFATVWFFRTSAYLSDPSASEATLGHWTLGIVVAVFIVLLYAALNLQTLKELFSDVDPPETDSPQQATGIARYMANPEKLYAVMGFLNVTLFLAPYLATAALRSWKHAKKAEQVEPEFVAPFLLALAKSGQKIEMKELAKHLNGRTIGDLIEQMSSIDGVTVRTGDKAGMYLSEPLKNELAAARDARKKSDS